jgi:hypothetical protein
MLITDIISKLFAHLTGHLQVTFMFLTPACYANLSLIKVGYYDSNPQLIYEASCGFLPLPIMDCYIS